MSSDNYILICKKTNEVFEGCASNDDLITIGVGKDLADAIRIAEEFEKNLWQEGIILEYGVHFSENTRGFFVRRRRK